MDLFGRYIFRQTALAMLLILQTLTVIVWVATALKQLSLLTKQGQGFGLFMQMTALTMPSLLAIITPVALLIACIHTLNKTNSDSELIVMTASGSTIWRLAVPLLSLAAIVTLVLAVLFFYLQPKSLRAFRSYIVQVRTDLLSQVIRPGRFSAPEKGLTFHIRDRDKTGDVLGLIVHDARKPDLTMSYMAERGRIIKQDDQAWLVMFDGHIHQKKKGRNAVRIIAFEQYVFDLSNLAAKRGKIVYKPREMYLGELLSPGKNNFFAKRRPGRIRAELHRRISALLYPALFVLIVLAALGHARTTRQGRVSSVVASFLVAAGLRVGGVMAINLSGNMAWAVGLVYGIPVIGIILALLIIHIRTRKVELPLPKVRILAQRLEKMYSRQPAG